MKEKKCVETYVFERLQLRGDVSEGGEFHFEFGNDVVRFVEGRQEDLDALQPSTRHKRTQRKSVRNDDSIINQGIVGTGRFI